MQFLTTFQGNVAFFPSLMMEKVNCNDHKKRCSISASQRIPNHRVHDPTYLLYISTLYITVMMTDRLVGGA